MSPRRSDTIPTSFFDDLYGRDPDPWKFQTSDYEKEKYIDTLSMLQQARYGSALEIGCSIGVFTKMLAPRCEQLAAVEPSAPALARARETCADLSNVTFSTDGLPDRLPRGPFELIVLSEVLYYLAAPDAELSMRRCCDAVAPGGEVVLCHWLGETDYPLTGDAAAELALAEAKRRGWTTRSRRRDKYRLDHLSAAEAP